jgi:cytochrome c peroxidase
LKGTPAIEVIMPSGLTFRIVRFPLRGIKESSPYMHDGRLLTLEDTVEFFNLISEAGLTAQEKADIVAFLRVL